MVLLSQRVGELANALLGPAQGPLGITAAIGIDQALEAAIAGAQTIGMKVKTVLADRAYGNVVGDQALGRVGIEDSVIPRQGKAAPIQQTRSWRRRYRYRSGAEGRISALKRGRGWSRSRLKGHAGATIWAGQGVFTHNLDRMVALT